MGGAVDGKRYRDPIGTYFWKQGWEPNVAVRMENIGKTDIVNPWLRPRFGVDYSSVEGMLDSIVPHQATEHEKARLLYWWLTSHVVHGGIFDPLVNGGGYKSSEDSDDIVRLVNIYGYSLCREVKRSFSTLVWHAGLDVRRANMTEHASTEVQIDGIWQFMDVDYNSYFLKAGTNRLMSVAEIEQDGEKIRNSWVYGVNGNYGQEERVAAYTKFFRHAGETGRNTYIPKTRPMFMTLRPNEALTWRWGHLDPPKYRAWKPLEQETGYKENRDIVANGLWSYAPDLRSDIWKKGAESISAGITVTKGGLMFRPAKSAARPIGEIVWKMAAPYLIVGGNIQIQGKGLAAAISFDGHDWAQIESADMDKYFPGKGRPRHEYFVRIRFAPGAVLQGLYIENDLQMAPLSLPEMTLGKNVFVYRSAGGADGRLKISHVWIERNGVKLPAAPERPQFPENGATLPTGGVTFAWARPPVTNNLPATDKIVDYQFQLSDDPQVRWPLTPTYNALVSVRAGNAEPRFDIYTAKLAYKKPYYWRVRAKSQAGVWGDWSNPWMFMVEGPARPQNVSFGYEPQADHAKLSWELSDEGTKPERFFIYASHYQGFSPLDQGTDLAPAFRPDAKNRKEPANLLATISIDQYLENGGYKLQKPYFPFYKVISAGKGGERSVSSDTAFAPRPLVTSPQHNLKAKVGESWSYRPDYVLSKGYWVQSSQFPSADKYTVSLLAAPAWVRLLPDGTLTGIPAVAGSYEINVELAIEGKGRASRSFTLLVE